MTPCLTSNVKETNMLKNLFAGAVPLILITACVTPPSFPPEAQPISAKDLHERLAGKT